MKLENISLATLAYFEANIMPQIPTSLGKAMAYGGLLLKMPELEQSMKKYSPVLLNEAGDIDLPKLHNIGMTVFDKVPKIEIADFEFDKNDFENFINFLANQG
jgi:hypothetical protein